MYALMIQKSAPMVECFLTRFTVKRVCTTMYALMI